MAPDALKVLIPAGDLRTRYVIEAVLRDGAGLPMEIVEHPLPGVEFVHGDARLCLAAADRSFTGSVPPLLTHTPDRIDAIDLLSVEHRGLGELLLSALFHVLAGTEEVESGERDQHDRFPAAKSRLFAAGYGDAPFVDLWGDAIVRALQRLWPALQADQRHPLLSLSHDVDAPYRYPFQSPMALMRAIASDGLRGRWSQAARAPVEWARVRAGDIGRDPFDHFAWMMDQAEEVGARSTFYVIAGHSGGRVDGDYDVDHPVMMRLWQSILDRGHRLGVHPSYNSFRSLPTLERERDRVIEIHRKLGLPFEIPPVRMHYLRFDPALTPALLAAAGFSDDSSLGFADHSGFRRGTCRPFALWDHASQRPLDLIEHPLLAMDATLLAERYEHLDQSRMEHRIETLAGWCRRFRGELTLLWHNNYFEQSWHFATYRAALRLLPAAA